MPNSTWQENQTEASLALNTKLALPDNHELRESCELTFHSEIEFRWDGAWTSVNLYDGSSQIVLGLRFRPSSNQFVCNTKGSSGWMNEERYPLKPCFDAKKSPSFTIFSRSDRYIIRFESGVAIRFDKRDGFFGNAKTVEYSADGQPVFSDPLLVT